MRTRTVAAQKCPELTPERIAKGVAAYLNEPLGYNPVTWDEAFKKANSSNAVDEAIKNGFIKNVIMQLGA